jgi:hypothetical protein
MEPGRGPGMLAPMSETFRVSWAAVAPERHAPERHAPALPQRFARRASRSPPRPALAWFMEQPSDI